MHVVDKASTVIKLPSSFLRRIWHNHIWDYFSLFLDFVFMQKTVTLHWNCRTLTNASTNRLRQVGRRAENWIPALVRLEKSSAAKPNLHEYLNPSSVLILGYVNLLSCLHMFSSFFRRIPVALLGPNYVIYGAHTDKNISLRGRRRDGEL